MKVAISVIIMGISAGLLFKVFCDSHAVSQNPLLYIFLFSLSFALTAGIVTKF